VRVRVVRRLQERVSYGIEFEYQSGVENNDIFWWIGTNSGTDSWQNPGLCGRIKVPAVIHTPPPQITAPLSLFVLRSSVCQTRRLTFFGGQVAISSIEKGDPTSLFFQDPSEFWTKARTTAHIDRTHHTHTAHTWTARNTQTC
jgi:hypothetical protein